MIPRPCRGGAGVGSVSFLSPTYRLPHSSISLHNITAPTPTPSPTGAGNMMYCIFLSTPPFVGSNSISFPIKRTEHY